MLDERENRTNIENRPYTMGHAYFFGIIIAMIWYQYKH